MTLQGVGIVLPTENYNVGMDLQVHPKRGHGSQATDKKGGGVLFSEEYNGLQESRAIEVAFAAPPSACPKVGRDESPDLRVKIRGFPSGLPGLFPCVSLSRAAIPGIRSGLDF